MYFLTHELKPPRRSRGGFNKWVKWLSRNQSHSRSCTFIHVSSNHIKLYISTRVILTTNNINLNKLFINFSLYKQISRREVAGGGGWIDEWTSVFNWHIETSEYSINEYFCIYQINMNFIYLFITKYKIIYFF